MKRVLFPGSFNPFTIGHADIVRRTLKIADEVIIAVGYNREKGLTGDVEERVETLRRLYAGQERVKVTAYDTLTVDFAREVDAQAMVRGVRDVKDFEYERQTAEVNRLISGMETILLLASPELAAVSSSIVRELKAFGMDVSRFLPSSATVQ